MPSDRTLLLLILSVAILTAAAILFTFGVLLLRARNERVARSWIDAHARWRELLMDVLAGGRPPDQLLREVSRQDRQRFVEFLAEYSRRVRGGEAEALMALARPFRPEIARMLRSRKPEIRAQAVQLASVLGGADAEKQISVALDDRAPLVNLVAARALAARQSHGYLQTILVRSARFAEVDPRYMSTTLAGVGIGAVKTLRKTFADAGANPYARAVAADALKRMRDLESGAIATRVLRESHDPEIQIAALRLLAEVGQPEHSRDAMPFMESPDFAVRAATIAALGKIGTARDIPAIEQRLRDPSPWVMLRAAVALRQLGGREALLAAAEHLADEPAVAAELRMMQS